jgi:hypothetical protein
MSSTSIQKIRSSHVNNITVEEYEGYEGLIWFDNDTGLLRIWDNNVPGGRFVYNNNSGLPSQANNAGKFLQTNGVDPSWQYVAGVFGLTIDGGTAYNVSDCLIVDGGGA